MAVVYVSSTDVYELAWFNEEDGSLIPIFTFRDVREGMHRHAVTMTLDEPSGIPFQFDRIVLMRLADVIYVLFDADVLYTIRLGHFKTTSELGRIRMHKRLTLTFSIFSSVCSSLVCQTL